LPDFVRYNKPKWEKYSKIVKTIPNGLNIYVQKGDEITKWPRNTPNISITRPSKIYQKLNFWYEIKASGYPVVHCTASPGSPTLLQLFSQEPIL
jgi:hypothetical protein